MSRGVDALSCLFIKYMPVSQTCGDAMRGEEKKRGTEG